MIVWGTEHGGAEDNGDVMIAEAFDKEADGYVMKKLSWKAGSEAAIMN